tara:strand:+ start:126 stop:518 length:393 start_codon:yes stop_codon:yes gene_type:complete
LVQVALKLITMAEVEETQNFIRRHITLTLLHSLFVVQVVVAVVTLLLVLEMLVVDLVEVNLHKHLLEVISLQELLIQITPKLLEMLVVMDAVVQDLLEEVAVELAELVLLEHRDQHQLLLLVMEELEFKF